MKISALILSLLMCLGQRAAYSHGADQGELWDAYLALGSSGSEAPKMSNEAILSAMRSPDLQVRENALAQMARNSVPIAQGLGLLLPVLKMQPANAEEAAFQKNAIVVLGAYRGAAKLAVPDLVKLLDNNNGAIAPATSGASGLGQTTSGGSREMAVRALGLIGWGEPSAMGAIVKAINAPDEATGLATIQIIDRAVALHPMGGTPPASALNPSVTAALQSALAKAVERPWKVALNAPVLAFDALGKLSEEARTLPASAAIERLKQLDALPMEQGAVAFAVLQNKPAPDEAIAPLLRLAAEGKSDSVKAAALLTLGHVGFRSEESVKAILSALSSGNPVLVFAAHESLTHLKATDKIAIGPLSEAVSLSNPVVQQEAARALVIFGAAAVAARPGIMASLQKSRQSPQETGVAYRQRIHSLLLVLIGFGEKSGVSGSAVTELLAPESGLLQGLSEEDAPTIRADLLYLVSIVGVPDDPAQRAVVLQQVVKGLSSANPRTFSSAARVAGALGKDAKIAVPLLLHSLELSAPAPGEAVDGARAVHPARLFEAMRALGKIGPAASAAVPLLTRIVDGQEELSNLLNGEARLALKQIQGG